MTLVDLISLLIIAQVTCASENAIFALTWMAGHCEYLGYSCDKIKYEQWDHQSFTIHGLWPSQNTDQYYGDFDFNLFRGTPLLQEMYNYWPPQPKLGGLPHFLWEFEWSRNGNRYADLMMNLAPGNFNRYGLTKRNEQLQIDYFQKVIELFKKLNVRGLTQKSYTRKQFSFLTKIPEESFYFVCSDAGSFSEVRICYKITSKGFTTRNCAKTYSNCLNEVARLTDWRSREIIKRQDPKVPGVVQVQYKKPIYIPIQEKKVDEKIESLSIQTKGKQAHNSRQQEELIIISVETAKHEKDIKVIREEILIEEEKEILDQIEFQQFESEEEFSHVFEQQNQNHPISQQELISTVQAYMVLSAILVTIFWCAVLILCFKTFRKEKEEPKIEEDTITNLQKIQNKQVQ